MRNKLLSLSILTMLSACGGGSGGNESPPAQNTNRSPNITSQPQVVLFENESLNFSIRASDADGDSITLSLSGDDAERFTLSDNQLISSSPFDYESPTDSDNNNIYSLTITASDGQAQTSQTFSVTVRDAFEGRVVDGPISNSQVFIDLNGNNVKDENEVETSTNADGRFALNVEVENSDNTSSIAIVAIGGFDTQTQKELPDSFLAIPLKTSADEESVRAFSNITPLSTVITFMLKDEAGDGKEKVEALLSNVSQTLSIDDVLNQDTWEQAESDDNELNDKAKKVQVLNTQLLTVINTVKATTSQNIITSTQAIATSLKNNQSDNTLNSLDSIGTISEILTEVVTSSESNLEQSVVDAIAQNVVKTNQTIKENESQITSSNVAELIKVVQETLPDKVSEVVNGNSTVEELNDTVTENIVVDTDNDGIKDVEDAFPDDPTETVDTDNDGIGNNTDTDDDNDGVNDDQDAFPLNRDEFLDNDRDGIGNNADTDDDNDGILDVDDALPFDAAENLDTDNDGIGNNADPDDDNDGVADADDAFPFNPNESLDTDRDGIGNNADNDDDGDGLADGDDAFPLDATETVDTDNDGIGNNADIDDDGDSVLDNNDAFPLDAAETADFDGDGIGNNADPDDDNDGLADTADAFPFNSDLVIPIIDNLDSDSLNVDQDITLDLFANCNVESPVNTQADADGDGVPDAYDTAPNNSSITKAVKFNLGCVANAGISESISESTDGELVWQPLKSGKSSLVEAIIPSAHAQSASITLSNTTNVNSIDQDGQAVTDAILASEGFFVAETVATPDGRYVYLITSPEMQENLADLPQEVCKLYVVDLSDSSFACVLDQDDVEPMPGQVQIASRVQYDFSGIQFRSDNMAIFRTPGAYRGGNEGVYLLTPDFETIQLPLGAPSSGNVDIDVRLFGWLDDEHVFILAGYYNFDSGEFQWLVHAINVQTQQIVATGSEQDVLSNAGSNQAAQSEEYIFLGNKAFSWSGTEFVSVPEQVGGNGIETIVDDSDRTWSFLFHADPQQIELIGSDIRFNVSEDEFNYYDEQPTSLTGSNIAYKNLSFSGDYVLHKFSSNPLTPVVSILNQPFEPNGIYTLENNQGYVVIGRRGVVWYYIPSAGTTGDIDISYTVNNNGALQEKSLRIPEAAIQNYLVEYPNPVSPIGLDDLRDATDNAIRHWSPEPDQAGFCVFEITSQQQVCAELDYNVVAFNPNQNTRFFPENYYQCSNNDCTVGVQNVVFFDDTLFAYFRDFDTGQYYQASANVVAFVENGADALTIETVSNTAGESDIMASANALRDLPTSTFEGFDISIDGTVITIDFGQELNEFAALPLFETNNNDVVLSEITWSDNRDSVTFSVDFSALEGSAEVDIAHQNPFFLPNSTTRYMLPVFSISLASGSGESVAPVFTASTELQVTAGSVEVPSFLASNGSRFSFALADFADAELFTIDPLSGELRFASAPVFVEQTTDTLDNEYQVRVQVINFLNEVVDEVSLTINVVDFVRVASGTVVDGYVAGATVFQDLNNNGLVDANEPRTLTDINGAYELILASNSRNARVRVINSGFDIGANEVLGAMLDTPPFAQDNHILTPVSTLVGRMLAKDYGLTPMAANLRASAVLDIALEQLPDQSLLGIDPLVMMQSYDDASVRDGKVYFHRQMQLMTLGNMTGAWFKHQHFNALRTLQEDFAGLSQVLVDADYLSALGHEQFFDSLANVLTQYTTLPNGFVLAEHPIEIVDFIDGQTPNHHYLYPVFTGDTASIAQSDVVLDLSNLQNIVNTQAQGVVPSLNVYLDQIPAAGESGTFTLSTTIFDGDDAQRASGERAISAQAVFEWESNGYEVTLRAPEQQVPVVFVDGSGVAIERNFANQTADSLTFSPADDVSPASLQMKLTSYISANLVSVGLTPENYFAAGDYYLTLTMSDSPLVDRENTTIANIHLPFNLADEHQITAYLDDGKFTESDASIKMRFSQPLTQSVVVNYTINPLFDTSGQLAQLIGSFEVPQNSHSYETTLPFVDDDILEENGLLSIDIAVQGDAITLGKSRGQFTLFDVDAVLDVTQNNQIITELQQGLQQKVLDTYSLLDPDETQFSSATGLSVAEYLAQGESTYLASVSTQVLTAFMQEIQTRFGNISTTGTEISNFATQLTVLVTAVRYVDFEVIEQSFVDGVLQISDTDFAALIDTELDRALALAAQTVTDPFGLETTAQFPDANIVILTPFDDEFSATDASELIATRDGVNVVFAGGANDKIIGGRDADTLHGGDGNDHLLGQAGTDLLYGDAGDDRLAGGLADDTLHGGSGDDLLLGEAGDDALYTGAGEDRAFGSIGADLFVVDGLGDKTIDGGSGDDTLQIDVAGITDVTDLTTSADGDYTVLSNADGSLVVRFKNIEHFSIAGVAYQALSQGYNASDAPDYVDPQYHTPQSEHHFGNGYGITSAYVSTNANAVIMYPFSATEGANFDFTRFIDWNSQLTGLLDLASRVTITGTSLNDTVNTGNNGYVYTPLTMSLGEGIDLVNLFNGYGRDSVDLGADNDFLYVMYDEELQYNYNSGDAMNVDQVSQSFTADELLDGGLGIDWLIIHTPYNADYGVTYILNTSPTQGFENVQGTKQDDVLTGDDGNNVIYAGIGADAVYGLAGDDVIYGAYGVNSWSSDDNDGTDTLFGGAGDDTLYGNAGDDELDGGLGRDVLWGDDDITDMYMPDMGMERPTGGADIFVLRLGDGGSSADAADIIMDFEDGTDQIGLADGLTYNNLLIEQGTGDFSADVLISSTGEYLAVVKDMDISDLDYFDIIVIDGVSIIDDGDAQDNILLGGSANDTLTTGAGIDIVVGYQGDDVITVNGLGDKTIDGGSGDDTLQIDVAGITDVTDLTTSADGDYTVLSNADGSLVVRFKNIEHFSIAGVAYQALSQGYNASDAPDYVDPQYHTPQSEHHFGNGYGITSAYVSTNANAVIMYPFSATEGANFDFTRFIDWNSQLTGLLDLASRVTITGTSLNDTVNTGNNGYVYTPLTMSLGEGIDLVNLFNGYGRDSVDLGADNDFLYVMYDEELQYNYNSGDAMNVDQVSQSFTADELLDGGLGIDWLIIHTPYNADYGVTYILNTSPTQGFENVQGTKQDDVLTGDDGNNVIYAGIGADAVYGLAGDDVIYGAYGVNSWSSDDNDGTDTLFGGAGDDTLYGNAGDDELDGGLGRDVLWGDDDITDMYMPDMGMERPTGGADIFVTRTVYASHCPEDADVVMDFEDGTDQLALAGGLAKAEVTVEQGIGRYAQDVYVLVNGQYLFIVKNIDVELIDDLDIIEFISTQPNPIVEDDGGELPVCEDISSLLP